MVDSARAEWLQSASRLTTVSDAMTFARWGDVARAATATSAIATEAEALVEAARQLSFVSGVVIEERVVVGSLLAIDQLRGGCHSIIVAGNPDYQDGATVFVLGGGRDHSNGTSYLDVLRRL